MGCLRLRLSQDKLSVEAVFDPALEGEVVNEQSVRRQLAESDFADFKLSSSGLTGLLNAVKSQSASEDKSPSIHLIAARVDAELSFSLSPDQMSASATIIAAFGGQPIEQSGFEQALQQMGITAGIDAEAVTMLLSQAQSAAPGSVVKRVVATGKMAVAGKNGCWISDVQTLRQQLQPRRREDGTVDLRDFGDILSVEPGQPLMHYQPPTVGKDGFNLTGECLVAVPGEEAVFVPSEGVVLDEKSNRIIASRSGMPVEIPGGMRVDNVYSVKTVNLASGDIHFDGSVIVQHDVEAGMKVIATGDVSVGGAVYFSNIEAGGDILVRKGVVGNQRQGSDNHFNSSDLSCALIAKGSLSLEFAQYARLKAGVGIQVTKQLLHCLAHTQGDIEIGKGGDKNSKLIGGVTRAGSRICCGIYGNEAFVATDVQLSPDVQELLDEVSICTEQIGLKQQLIDDLKQILPKINALPKGDVRQEKLTKVVNTINHAARQLVALEQKIEDLKQQESERIEAAGIVAMKTIFPNVSVSIAGHKHKTRRVHQGGGLCYRKPEVIHDPGLK